jgi:inner membrane protein
MDRPMPSPIGHALGGVAIAWAADLVDGRRSSPRLVTACAGLAMLPDVDLLLPAFHRTATHSLTAAIVVIIVVALTGKVTGRPDGVRPHRASWRGLWRTAFVCGAAYASHLLLDWLGADNRPPRGIQLLWPFSDRWFISDWDIFRETARQHFFSASSIGRNIVALAQELAILLPVVVVLWLVRVKAAPRLSTELASGNHPAE